MKGMNIIINVTDPVWTQNYPELNQPVNPCLNCSNNPANNPFATGICHCALPSMYNIRY